MDYEDKLERAYDNIDQIGKTDERLEIPDPEVTHDGSFTVYNNFHTTAEIINREESEILTFLQEEIATSGSIDGTKARLKGDFSDNDISEVIDEYIEMFIRCNECGSMDTEYREENGVNVIRCTACGAARPKPEH